MTIQRALEIVKNEMPYESGVINEALNMVRNAVEKQIPKKPLTRNVANYKRFFCPNCKKFIITKVNDDSNEVFIEGNGSITKEVQKYCGNCGQHLDCKSFFI